MDIRYSLSELVFCVLLYSFLGWGVEVVTVAVRQRHFENRGFLNLPLSLPVGITMTVLAAALPTLPRNLAVQFGAVWIVSQIVRLMGEQFDKSVSRRRGDAKRLQLAVGLAEAAVYLTVYLVIHPFVFALTRIMPDLLEKWIAVTVAAVILVDYLGVRHVLRTKLLLGATDGRKERTRRLADRIGAVIWKRLTKAYPGIETETVGPSRYVFARGICFDKMVWVFLISSFLGALIEMAFCRVTGGAWMNRSSVLYGAFSFVWGFGAVVLTVSLQRLADKEDRKVFLAGFLVGGAYEYLASVFTEIVFGTVFWDYSHMPLNIGGRTNVLYCIFWGILTVLWIKVIYPPMDRGIEKMRPLAGKILTWVIVVLMACNGVLTSAAMVRYSTRTTQPQPANFAEAYLDEQYDDAWMENRWPNMKVTVE